MKPDISVYATARGKRTILVLRWPDVELFIEWKTEWEHDGYCDIFHDDDDILDADTIKATHTRGQIYSYAANVMDSQYRLSVFAISICGNFARFYRFDPSCVVVTEPVSFRLNPEVVVDFLVRFSSMTPAERGHDPTVIPATPAEKRLFQSRLKDYRKRVSDEHLRLHPDVETLDAKKVVKIQVNNEEDGTTHWYLACKPGSLPVNYSPCGRLSRGFIATPLSSEAPKGKLLWLKDCWRSDQVESEASIYHYLKESGVENIPDVKYVGDVLYESVVQETFNDTLLDDETADSWRRPVNIIHHMVHYRLVSELLIPVDGVEDAQELLLVGRDILNGENDQIPPPSC